jgi:fructose-specific phosphotransferase system IIC component
MEPRDQAGFACALLGGFIAAILATGFGFWLSTSFLLGVVAGHFGGRFGGWLFDRTEATQED